VDAGDENYVPENSFVNMEKTVNIINEFFENPKQKQVLYFGQMQRVLTGNKF